MAYFQPFQGAKAAKTPQFIAAEIGQAAADNAEKARINEIRAQNQAGAASVYKGVTSKMEKDPIAEALRGGWDKMVPDTSAAGVSADVLPTTTAAPELMTGAEVMGSVPGATAAEVSAATGVAELGAAGTELGALSTAATPAAGAAGGGGVMAGLGTAMPWLGAAMAAYALLNR